MATHKPELKHLWAPSSVCERLAYKRLLFNQATYACIYTTCIPMKVPTEFLFWFVSGNIMQCVILDFIYSIISFVFNLILHDIIKGMVQPNQNTKDYGKPF